MTDNSTDVIRNGKIKYIVILAPGPFTRRIKTICDMKLQLGDGGIVHSPPDEHIQSGCTFLTVDIDPDRENILQAMKDAGHLKFFCKDVKFKADFA